MFKKDEENGTNHNNIFDFKVHLRMLMMTPQPKREITKSSAKYGLNLFQSAESASNEILRLQKILKTKEIDIESKRYCNERMKYLHLIVEDFCEKEMR